jgi:hypothetical protein
MYPSNDYERCCNASPVGTTDHVHFVDAEVGTILHVAVKLEGREFLRVAEVTEIVYDE